MRPFRTRHTLRKSQRIIDKGSISRFLEVSGELVHVKQSLKNKHSKDVTYCRDDSRDRRVARDDYDVDDDFSSGHDEEEDDGDGDDDELCWMYKKGYDDKDWLPKSQLGIRSHPHVDDNVRQVDRVRQVGPAHRDSKLTANDYVKSSMDESYNFHSDCGRGYGTIEAYTCDDGVDNHSRSIGYAGCSNIVAYVRCKRKLSSIMQRSKLRNMHCLPGWIEKKRRVLYQRQHKVNKWACAIQLDLDSNFHAYNEQLAAVKEVEEAGSQAMPQVFEGSNNVTFLQMPTQPSSPPVFLRTVLEGLPNDPLESVHIEGPHEAHSAYISLSPKQNNLSRSLPHHAKKLGPNSAKTISFENCVKKRKRKKHRPKVLCDVFYQGKYTRKTRKKSFSEQVKNSDLKDKQSKSPREPHLKKTRKTRKKSFSEQVTNWDLKDKQSKLPREPHIKKKQALKSSTYTTKGKLTQKQRATLIIKNSNILECKNLNVLRSSKLSEGQSLAPYRVGDWTGIGGPLKDGWALQNLLDEVAFSSKGSVIPFPIYREVIFKNLGSLKFSFENQVKLIQELTKGFRGYQMAFVREQRQSVPLCESGSWHGPVEFIKETGVFSPMWSKAEVSSPLAVIQNLNNQLEVVATDQSRELINVKPRRVSSKIRAEVQLDPESERIWPLIASGGIPEMFEDVLHWERERPLMERQVRSFIDIMKSVQGSFTSMVVWFKLACKESF